MTIYSHAKICLVVSILSLLVLAFGVSQDLHTITSRNYLFAAAVAFGGGFLVREYLMRQEAQSNSDEVLDELSPGVTTAALATIWIPIVLAASAVFFMSWWGTSAEKISWILVVLAGMCGQHLASVRILYKNR